MLKTALALVLLLSASAWAEPETEAPLNQSGPYPRGPFSGTTQGILRTGDEEGFGLGPSLPDPSAFDGSNRTETVLEGSRFNDNFGISGHYGHYFDARSRLMVTGQAGTTNLSGDLDYSFTPEGMDGYFSAYVNHTRYQHIAYRQSGPATGVPWLGRTSTGFGYTSDPSQRFILSSALVLENISLYSSEFGGRLPASEGRRRPLTISPDGSDTTLSLRFAGAYLDVNDLQFPSEGDKLNFAIQQDVPVGSAQVDMTRFHVNYSHFQPIGDPTLILNVQAGITRGRVAPYEAYNLGGSNSVRGYQLGELGAATRFLQLSTELRVPLGDMEVFEKQIPLRFATFVDYATTFASESDIYGESFPRKHDTYGLGYGLGLQAVTDFGLVRLEAARARTGQNLAGLTIGDRY